MTAKGHLLFSVIIAIFVKSSELSFVIGRGHWWHIIPSVMLASLLPDIDHPKSLLGQRLGWISKVIYKIFGHRGFTHSLLGILMIMTISNFIVPKYLIISEDIIQSISLGYISHIIADALTPFGVPLLWPLQWRFRLPIFVLKK